MLRSWDSVAVSVRVPAHHRRCLPTRRGTRNCPHLDRRHPHHRRTGLRAIHARGRTTRLAGVADNRAVLMLRRARDDDRTEFTMITIWDDLASIVTFTGPDPEHALFYPRDDQFLAERDLRVAHHQVYGSVSL